MVTIVIFNKIFIFSGEFIVSIGDLLVSIGDLLVSIGDLLVAIGENSKIREFSNITLGVK